MPYPHRNARTTEMVAAIVETPWWNDDGKRAEFFASLSKAVSGAVDVTVEWTQDLEERDSPSGRHLERRPSGHQRIVISVRTNPGEWPRAGSEADPDRPLREILEVE